MTKKYNEAWTWHYQYLEDLRQSGVVNMYGAAPYLVTEAGGAPWEARQILVSWMENYDDLVADGICVRGESE